MSSGGCVHSFGQGEHELCCVAHINSKTFLAGCHNGSTKLWDVTTGACLHAAKTPSTVSDVAGIDDTRVLVCGDCRFRRHEIQTWNVVSGKCLRTFEGHNDEWLNSIAIVDESTFISLSQDGTIKLWDCTNWPFVKHLVLLRELLICTPARARVNLKRGREGTANCSHDELSIQSVVCDLSDDVFRHVVSFLWHFMLWS